MSVTTLLAISLGAILTNNFIFAQFLGICPFLGVSKKIDTAIGMGAAVTFVMGLASAFCYLINMVLVSLHLEFMQTVAYILVIAGFVTCVDLLLKAFVPALSSSLGVFIPLIVVNCIILGRAEGFASKNGVGASAVDGICQGIGYTLVLIVMCVFREFFGAGTFGGGLLGGGALGSAPGVEIFPAEYGVSVLTLPVGGFLTLGCLIAVMQWALAKSEKKKEAK